MCFLSANKPANMLITGMLMSNEVIVRINPYTEVLPYTYIYSIYIKGGTVHRCHGSVCKLVRGSTDTVQYDFGATGKLFFFI